MSRPEQVQNVEPLDFEQPLPSSILNIDEKTRSNFFPWRGQFSPELVEALLRNYARPADVILDPFAGSGTVLLEAGRLALPAYASEINPAAAIIARLYEFINVPLAERKIVTAAVSAALRRCLGAPSLIGEEVAFADVDRLLEAANLPRDDRAGHLLRALVILLDLSPGTPLDPESVWQKWVALERRVLSLPHSEAAVRVLLGDARALALMPNSVDFVITSPPYINVFNYHHNFRGSVEALAWAPLHVAKSEIGSNRKFRGNRFLTVVQYQLDMALALQELRRVASDRARVLFIVGRESSVQKTAFYNGRIVEAIAPLAGFSRVFAQERVFRNRFGVNIFEDILHLVPCGAALHRDQMLARARSIADDVLRDALSRVPAETEPALRQAIERAHEVIPSPVFRAREAKMERKSVHGTANTAP